MNSLYNCNYFQAFLSYKIIRFNINLLFYQKYHSKMNDNDVQYQNLSKEVTDENRYVKNIPN